MNDQEIARSLDEVRGLIRAKAWALARRSDSAWVDVEDAVQELTLRLLPRLARYDPDLLPLRAYVRLILRQGISNWIRAAARDRLAGQTLLTPEQLEGVHPPPSGARDPHWGVNLRHDIDRFLDRLTTEDRTLVQKVLELGNFRAAAAALGIAPNTVTARLRRLQELASELSLEDYLADFSAAGGAAG